jgi:cob(I)alamin adenosyltransferase
MALSTRDDYRQNATDCLRLARIAPNPSDRAALVNMARTWSGLAERAAAISCLAELVAVESGIKP